MTTKSFIPYSLTHGLLADLSNDEFPTRLRGFDGGWLTLLTAGTHYGYIWEGEPILMIEAGTFQLAAGMYFSVPGEGKLLGGKGIVITRLGYQGVFSIGGPVEPTGRLLYIDGCRDSLLIPPVMQGDPCLNALYFPDGIDQTPHTHSSVRVGMIVSGRGECITPDETISLKPGQVFVIPAGGLHSFRTTDSPMVVIAYHPTSETGPTHELHPMRRSTLVNGVSSSQLQEIATRA